MSGTRMDPRKVKARKGSRKYEDIAAKTSYSLQMVHAACTGTRDPKLSLAVEIANELGCTVDELLEKE